MDHIYLYIPSEPCMQRNMSLERGLLESRLLFILRQSFPPFLWCLCCELVRISGHWTFRLWSDQFHPDFKASLHRISVNRMALSPFCFFFTMRLDTRTILPDSHYNIAPDISGNRIFMFRFNPSVCVRRT